MPALFEPRRGHYYYHWRLFLSLRATCRTELALNDAPTAPLVFHTREHATARANGAVKIGDLRAPLETRPVGFDGVSGAPFARRKAGNFDWLHEPHWHSGEFVRCDAMRAAQPGRGPDLTSEPLKFASRRHINYSRARYGGWQLLCHDASARRSIVGNKTSLSLVVGVGLGRISVRFWVGPDRDCG